MEPGVLGIDNFLPHPAFRTYALCAAILALEMLFSAAYTAVQRGRHQGYANAEDARAFGAAGATVPAAYCWTFTLAHIGHTVAYTRNLQPWRAIFWGVGVLAIVGMAVQLVLAVL